MRASEQHLKRHNPLLRRKMLLYIPMATPSSFIVIYNVELSTTMRIITSILSRDWKASGPRSSATRAYSIQFEFLRLNGVKEKVDRQTVSTVIDRCDFSSISSVFWIHVCVCVCLCACACVATTQWATILFCAIDQWTSDGYSRKQTVAFVFGALVSGCWSTPIGQRRKISPEGRRGGLSEIFGGAGMTRNEKIWISDSEILLSSVNQRSYRSTEGSETRINGSGNLKVLH